jgi:hypothetical protein
LSFPHPYPQQTHTNPFNQSTGSGGDISMMRQLLVDVQKQETRVYMGFHFQFFWAMFGMNDGKMEG